MKWLSALVVTLALSGCGTTIQMILPDDVGNKGMIYSGVRFDCECIQQLGPLGKLFFLCDLPLSLVGDTVFLPITILCTYWDSVIR